MTDAVARARELLASVRRVAVLTGAGMSAESGIPTFRDALTGLWARFNPMELASREGFRASPPRVWDWYDARRAGVRQAEPNAGHRALAAAAHRYQEFTLITQNVDGLHARAGSVALEIHGNILRSKCFDECGVVFEQPQYLPRGAPPRCPNCGAFLRPDVVWFGEMPDLGILAHAEKAALGAELMLVVGTSGLVYPAADLPVIAHEAGARIIVINTEDSELDALADLCVRGKAGEVLPELWTPGAPD